MNRRLTIPAQSRVATRERLLTAATALFAERGLHGVTSHEIARSAGAATGTFYVHFKDKREVFREIVARAIEQLRRRLESAPGRAGANVEERDRAHTEALLQFAETNRDLVRVLFHPVRDMTEQALGALELLSSTRSRGGSEGANTGAGAGPEDLDHTVVAEALHGMLARVVTWWAEEPGRVPREVVIRTLTRLQRLADDPGARSVGVSIGEGGSS